MDDQNKPLEVAQMLAAELNRVMALIPGHRLQSAGTRISIEPSGGHYHDRGLDMVAEFHHAFGAHIASEPGVPWARGDGWHDLKGYARTSKAMGEVLKLDAQRAAERDEVGGSLLLIRLQLIQEELAELAEAMVTGDIVGCLDALTDLTYVVDGTYLTLGLGHYKAEALAEVHRSNMSKMGADGKPITSSAGRIVKGPNYSPPDLASLLGVEDKGD